MVHELHFVDFHLVLVEEEGLIHALLNLEFFRENDELLEEEHLTLDKVHGGRGREGRGIFEERCGHFGDE